MKLQNTTVYGIFHFFKQALDTLHGISQRWMFLQGRFSAKKVQSELQIQLLSKNFN